MKQHRYGKAPIQEVICDIIVDENTPWDLAVPGILYEGLRTHFKLREKRRIQEVEVAQSTAGSALTFKDSERAIFLQDDRRCLVQVGDRLVAVNQLPPYPGWETFKKSIETAYTALRVAVEVKGIRALVLRYVDRIEIPGPRGKIEDYFLFRPHFEGVQEGEPLNSWSAFIIGIQAPLNQDRDMLRIQLVLGPVTKEKTTFILEASYALVRPGAVEPDKVLDWLETAHLEVVQAFEKAITDKLRSLFQPEPE